MTKTQSLLFIVSQDLRVLSSNSALNNVLGKNPIWPELLSKIKEFLISQDDYRECQIDCKPIGQYFWQLNRLKNDNGEVQVTVYGKSISTTDRQTLLNKLENLQFVTNNVPHYLLWKDRNSVYLGCNDQ